MADSGGGASGILGVLVGAVLVIMIGGAVLMASGKIGGGGGPSVSVNLPGSK